MAVMSLEAAIAGLLAQRAEAERNVCENITENDRCVLFIAQRIMEWKNGDMSSQEVLVAIRSAHVV